jgi:hypothetical protein
MELVKPSYQIVDTFLYYMALEDENGNFMKELKSSGSAVGIATGYELGG